VLEKIKQVEQKTGKKMGLGFIIPQSLPNKAKLQEDHQEIIEEDHQVSKWGIISPMKHGPLSLDDIVNKASRTKQRLYDSARDKEAIEKDTSEQHKTRIWYDVRQPRITASKCKRCLLKPTTSPTKAIAEVLSYNPFVQTKAMKEGIEWEPKILNRFENETNHQVSKSGFILSESHPFLGASPDGITEENNLVEVKKVVFKDGEVLMDAMCRLGIYKKTGTELVINKSHKYYYQIQQHMFCSKQLFCHFIVSNGIEMHTPLFHLILLFGMKLFQNLSISISNTFSQSLFIQEFLKCT
jgi:hypothetical protein